MHEKRNIQVSVVILAHRRLTMLMRAVESLRKNFKTENWELIIIGNGCDQAIIEYAKALDLKNYSFVQVKECTPGEARNLAIAKSQGEILLFLDDDIQVMNDMIEPILQIFQDSSIAAAGGANLTPPHSKILARASGYVFESWFGMAGMHRRYKQNSKTFEANEHSLILCSLAVRKSAILEKFPSGMISNEENVLLQRISGRGLKSMHCPQLSVYHERRSTITSIFSQVFKYGFGRAQNIFRVPSSLSIIYFIPLIWLSYLLALVMAFRHFSFWPIHLYWVLGLASSLLCFIRKGDGTASFFQFLLYPIVHASYALGFLVGLLAEFFRIQHFILGSNAKPTLMNQD